MLKLFYPNISGVYSPERLSRRFLDNLVSRVRSGLFPLASRSRNRYEIKQHTRDRLTFCSSGLLTGINVGLNDVTIQLESNRIRYDIKYWVWTLYSVTLGFSVGVFATVTRFVLFPTFFTNWMQRQLNTSQNTGELIFWGIVVFWGILWPWILIVLHKKPLSKLIVKIFDEVNTFDE